MLSCPQLWRLALQAHPVPPARPAPLPQSQGDGAPPEALFMREACYRCIGEGYNHLEALISFPR